jgi:DNA-binding CsgD family transcriptional regulator
VAGKAEKRARRTYRPKVEALEALRLLSEGLATPLAPAVLSPQVVGAPIPTDFPEPGDHAWDTALGQTRLADLLASPVAQADPQALESGLSQLDRYLARAWARAGISSQHYDDCTQAVYTTLLQNLGRDGFDHLVEDIGHQGVRQVLNAETSEGPDFFRAVDMVKKRAQREKSFQSLDAYPTEVAAPIGWDGATADWRGALNEAIDRSLSSREADLIRATLQGKTPAEIAAQWGVAPKTVSNEKTRAIQKLREALVADMAD